MKDKIYYIFILFLIITSNFLAPLFPCEIQKLLKKEYPIKHVFAFLTLLFFVVLADKNETDSFSTSFIKSLFFYFMFILILKTKPMFFISAMFLLFVLNIVDIKYSNEVNERIILMKNCLFYLTMSLIIIGFSLNYAEKKEKFRSNFKLIDFLFQQNCS